MPAPRSRRLVPLTAGVLVVHGLLLLPPLASLEAKWRPPARGFATRSIVLPAAVPVPPQPPVATQGVEGWAPAAPLPAAVAPAPARAPLESAVTGLARYPTPQAARDEAPAASPAPAAAVDRWNGAAPAAIGRMGTPAGAAAAEGPVVPPPTLVIPAPARHRYEVQAVVRGSSVQGHAVLEWRHDGHAYEARLALETGSQPARLQRSAGRITAQGLAPDYFAERGGRGEQATHFDHEQGRVVFSVNRPQALLVAGLQDRLSVLLQLSALVAGDPGRYAPGARIVVPTAGTREAGDWTLEVEGEEDLQLPGGTTRALKLRRPPRHRYDQVLELWLRTGGDYAPVRLRLTNPNGDTADHRWSATDRG